MADNNFGADEIKKDRFHAALFNLSDRELWQIVDDLHSTYKEAFEDVLDIRLLQRGAFLARDSGRMKRPIAMRMDSAPHENQIIARDEPTTHEVQPSETQPSEIPPSGIQLSIKEKTFTAREFKAWKCEQKGELKSLTKNLLVTLATCAIGAIVQGWSQQSLVGANLNWPLDLHIARSENGSMQFNEPNGLKIFGLVNAIPYFAASILGAWVSDPITASYGRRSALFVAGLCSLAAPIGGYYCQTWYELLICRFIQGVGMGAKSSVVPVLESEVSPPKMRGKLLVSWQTFVGVGIFLGASANCMFAGHWRLQFAIAFVPALPLVCLCYVIRESPRWLIKKGRYGDAYIALKDLRQTPLQAARDLYTIHAQLKLEEILFTKEANLSGEGFKVILKQKIKVSTRRTGFFQRLRQLLKWDRNRRAVASSCIAMTAQQFSGINIYAFLATTIFGDSGIKGMKTLWFTFGFALTNAIFSAPAFFIINKFGRRTLLIWSLLLMFPLLILTGHYFDVGKDGSAIALVLVYTAVYSPGAGVIPFMYSSEVFPLAHREVGMSLAVSVNLGIAGALAMVVPQYPTSLNTQKLLGTFAALDGIAAVMVWLFMRSPDEAVSLEEMNYLFLPPFMSYATYQFKVVLPWVVRHPFRYLGAVDQSLEEKESFVSWYNRGYKTENGIQLDSNGVRE